MAYTTKELVQAMVRDLKITLAADTSPTVVTEEKITEWISQQDAYINGRIASYYSIPVVQADSPISFEILKLIATYKVTHMVKTVLELTSENSDKQQDVQTNLDKKAEKMLDNLIPQKGEPPVLKLPDAPMLETSPENAALFSLEAQTPTFTKGGNNW